MVSDAPAGQRETIVALRATMVTDAPANIRDKRIP